MRLRRLAASAASVALLAAGLATGCSAATAAAAAPALTDVVGHAGRGEATVTFHAGPGVTRVAVSAVHCTGAPASVPAAAGRVSCAGIPAGRNAVLTLTPIAAQPGPRVTVTFVGSTLRLRRVHVTRFHTGDLVTFRAVLDRGRSSVGVPGRTLAVQINTAGGRWRTLRTQGTGSGGVTDVRQKIARNARLRVVFGGGGTLLGAVSTTSAPTDAAQRAQG